MRERQRVREREIGEMVKISHGVTVLCVASQHSSLPPLWHKSQPQPTNQPTNQPKAILGYNGALDNICLILVNEARLQGDKHAAPLFQHCVFVKVVFLAQKELIAIMTIKLYVGLKTRNKKGENTMNLKTLLFGDSRWLKSFLRLCF